MGGLLIGEEHFRFADGKIEYVKENGRTVGTRLKSIEETKS